LLRNGPMTQTALVRELNAKTKALRRHLNWLVSNGIVIKHGSTITIYEPNPNHPITKTLQELLNLNYQQRKK
jgi:hypothetical protein